MWLSTDPLSGYNPIFEVEHYIDGEHNGGVFNSFNHNTYGYCYQNPVLYVDPNGKQAIAGALIGAFTEYVSIVGEKMLFNNKTFKEANKDLTWRDGLNIGIAAGTGSISGVAKFTKWVGTSNGRKILAKVLEIGINSLEDVLKQYVKGEGVDLTQTLISTLTGLGMESVLKGTSLSKHIKKQDSIIEKADNRIAKIESGKGNATGKAKRIKPEEAKKAAAQKEKQFYKKINDGVNKTATSGTTTITTGTYNNNK